MVASPLFGSLSDKHGSLPLLTAGLLAMSGTLVALGFLSSSYPMFLLITLIVLLGVSMGMITSPNTSLVMGRVDPSHLGLISSLLALSRNLGMMFGTAAGGAFIAGADGYRMVFVLCLALVFGSLVLLLVTVRQARHRRRHEETVLPS
ncbi:MULTISPECIES: MFS transporter [Paenibacillus]|uniref:MFS transporter n=1 Tax=Paenibacillus TaxID=44249 RepID=UPI00211B3A2E|nr:MULTISPECIES: MFS transporter [unclassified Paenibacillus]